MGNASGKVHPMCPDNTSNTVMQQHIENLITAYSPVRVSATGMCRRSIENMRETGKSPMPRKRRGSMFRSMNGEENHEAYGHGKMIQALTAYEKSHDNFVSSLYS